MRKILLLVLVVSFVSSNAQSDTIVTFGFGSCNQPTTDSSLQSITTLTKAMDTLDAFIWLGDNLYYGRRDWSSFENMMHKYQTVFETPALQQFLASGNHLAILDDHDYGPNDSDGDFEGKKEALEAFKTFWNPEYEPVNEDSYYGLQRIGPVDFFFLDNRTFRTRENHPNATIFGEEQLNWFQEAYMESDAPVKIVLMGGQFLTSAAVFENVANYPGEQIRIKDIVSQDNNNAVFFLTGDRHHGEISVQDSIVGPTIVDVTSSPLTATPHEHHNEPNPFRVHEGTTDERNFGTIQLKIEDAVLKSYTVKLHRADGSVIFEYTQHF